jgi:protein SCO1
MAEMRRTFTIVLLGLLVVATGLTAAYALNRATPASFHGTHLGAGVPAHDFTLQSADGPVTLSDFRGQAVLMFFGYTHCPDVCPFTMAKLGLAMEVLGERSRDVQVLLVTVDPDLDTPERLGDYVRHFHPAFLGLTGSRARLEGITRAYGVYAGDAPPVAAPSAADDDGHGGHDTPADPDAPAEPAAPADRDAHAGHGAHQPPPRLIDHTSQVFGIDRRGDYRLLWGTDVTADQIAEDVRQILRR